MAYEQWIAATILTRGFNATIKNATHSYGKFYCGTKDNEVAITNVDSVVVRPDDPFTLFSCGRDKSPTGTEGSFDIYDGTTHVGSFLWDCSWGSGANEIQWIPGNDGYLSQVSGGALSGAIGELTLTAAKMSS